MREHPNQHESHWELQDMAAQLITLAGVIVGALATFLSTSLADRSRFRRVLETRWDERKLDVYAEYVSCVKAETRIARKHSEPDIARGESLTMSDLDAAEALRSHLFEKLVLLADPRVTEAAHVVNREVWDLLRIATHTSTADESKQSW
ncbi:hypothetical protein ACQPW1_16600 [Nocardia sp. CA-128927]|uniref:hypothetical protein n=1 Tax=Nocardia sp. CA-128927 TaxID=3239975 RepID=UPI003D979C9D